MYYPLRGSMSVGRLSTGDARLTASLTRGYRSKTPIGVELHTVRQDAIEVAHIYKEIHQTESTFFRNLHVTGQE